MTTIISVIYKIDKDCTHLNFLAAKQQLYILESDSLTHSLTDSALTLITIYIDLKVFIGF